MAVLFTKPGNANNLEAVAKNVDIHRLGLTVHSPDTRIARCLATFHES